MAMVQCENRHFYDNRKHTYCPHCPVPGLKDVKVPGTQAASMNRASTPVTAPATEPAWSTPAPEATHRAAASPARGSTSGVTVGVFQKQMRFDPVCGWLVCVEGVNKGRDYRLHSDRNTVGRAPNMDVCIEGDDTISREDHCQVVFSPRSKTFSIVPGTGRNLVYLNGEDVLAAMKLEAYDRLDLGRGGFLFLPFCSDRFDWGPEKAPEPEPIVDAKVERPVRRPGGGEPTVG